MLRRRLVTVPGYVLAAIFWLAAAPLWLSVAAVVDGVRGRGAAALRSGAFLGAYLGCELLGIVASAGLWGFGLVARVDPERWTDLHFRLEAWWGTTLFRAVVAAFGLRVDVEDDADLGRGPYLLLLRHASSADTLLASALVSRPHGVRLRYVLKRELLWDPCIDIVGNRLPNAFVDRLSSDGEREIRRIQALTRGLGPRDGILLYPEGTRFSESKRRRALERFRSTGDAKMVDYVRSTSFVLPPRPGGTLGILEAAPELDVVVCAHTGFEGTASLAGIWGGGLVRRSVHVRFRRIPRGCIPTGREARRAWLLEEWRRVDEWIERCRSKNGSA